MQGALARLNGHTKVPAQIGTGGGAKSPRSELSSTKTYPPPHDPSHVQVNSTLPTSTIAAGTTAGGGVPVPLLVLGGLALVLAAAGARHGRDREAPPALADRHEPAQPRPLGRQVEAEQRECERVRADEQQRRHG